MSKEKAKKCEVYILLGLLKVAAVALCILVWYLINNKSTKVPGKNQEEKFIAIEFLKNLNSEEDPCKNFYHYACGGFIKNTILPEGKEKWAVENELEMKVEDQVRTLLGSFDNSQGTLSRPYQHLMRFYSLCKEQDVKNKTQILAGVRDVLREAGGWPLLEEGLLEKPDIFQIRNMLHEQGLFADSLLQISFNTNSTESNFKVEKPKLLIKGLGKTFKEDYAKYITKVIDLFEGNWKNGDEKVKVIVELESALAEMTLSNSDQLPAANYTIAELKSLPSLSWLPWNQLLQTLLPHSVPINSLYNVSLEDPGYVTQLRDLVTQYNESGLIKYMIWRAAEDLIPWGTLEMRELYWQFRKLPGPPFFQQCIQQISRGMATAVSSLYANRIFSNSSKIQAVRLVENIRQEIVDQNESSSGSVANVAAHIAYPEEIINTTLLEDFYKDISGDSLVKAWLSLSRWRRSHDLSQHVSNITSSDWEHFNDVFTPRATFSAVNQYIDINAGFLQPPVFSPKLPSYINYGGLGFLVAHHLVHALPTLTVSDYRGLSHAYRAYKRAVTSPEPVLTMLQHYSQDQLFMLSFANLFCTKYKNVTTNTSTRERMVNVIIKHTPEFYNVFNCTKPN